MGDAVYCRHGRDVACYWCWECDAAEDEVKAREKARAEKERLHPLQRIPE